MEKGGREREGRDTAAKTGTEIGRIDNGMVGVTSEWDAHGEREWHTMRKSERRRRREVTE